MVHNCSSHITGELFRLLGGNLVKIVKFAPQTISIFHPLDLPLFARFKKRGVFDGTR
jgi:hypothetical protein